MIDDASEKGSSRRDGTVRGNLRGNGSGSRGDGSRSREIGLDGLLDELVWKGERNEAT